MSDLLASTIANLHDYVLSLHLSLQIDEVIYDQSAGF